MSEDRKRRLFTAYLFSFMVAFALSGTMFSTALPKIIEDYRLSLSMAALFPICQSVGNLLAMLMTGLIGDRLKKSALTGALFLGMGALLSVISLMPAFAALLALIVALGVSTSALNLMVTAYVSDLYCERRARYISLLHVYFGFGSLLGPLYPMLLSRMGFGWHFAYRLLGIAALLIAGGYFLLLARHGEPARLNQSPQETRAPRAMDYRRLLAHRGMLALCAVSFLYMGGHQGAFSTWFQTYLQRADPLRYTPEFTSMCMTVYWIGMVVSRMIGAGLTRRFPARVFLLAGSLMGALALASGLLLGQAWSWVVAVAMLGLCTGVIYPLMFSISCEWFPESSARVSSFVGIFSSVGSICFGWAIGMVAERSFQIAMWIPVCVVALVFWIVLLFLKPGTR